MSPMFRRSIVVVLPLLAACDAEPKADAPKADASKADAPKADASRPPAAADPAKAGAPKADADAKEDSAPVVADGDAAPADEDDADAEDAAAAGATASPKISTKVVQGLPAAAAWKATGPLASVVLGTGDLIADPKEAGDGELPQSPEKGIEPDTGTFMNHVDRFGWSADGKSFAMCMQNESECAQCVFVDETGKQDNAEICGPKSKAEARWKAGKYATGPLTWAAGADVTITWKQYEVADDDGPDLVIGVRADGSDAIAEVSRMRMAQGADGVAFPELLVLDKSGSRLAAVGHGWMGEGSDEWQVRIFGTGWLAAEAYNAAGLKLLGDKKDADAAEMFAKATVADPGAWKGPYNAACAWARTKDANAEAALAEAVRRGGDAVRKKARKDTDFDGVRSEAWFTKIVPAA